MTRYSLLLISLAFFVVSGCATVPQEKDLTASLLSTAQEYWKLRMKDDYEKTYKMEYSEGLPAMVQYVNKVQLIRRINTKSHQVKNPAVEGLNGAVEVEFMVVLPNIGKPIPQTLRDLWIYKDGRWQHKLPPDDRP